MWLAIKRFPPEKRGFKSCRDCGTGISRRRRLAINSSNQYYYYSKGRCRACYFQFRKRAKNTEYDIEQKMKKSVDRPRAGTTYTDTYGNEHWAYEEIGAGFTVAGAWASLRKCWKAYGIASGNFDEDGKRIYARRIVLLCGLLKKHPPRFQELETDETMTGNEDDKCYYEHDDEEEYSEGFEGDLPYYSGGNVDPNCSD